MTPEPTRPGVVDRPVVEVTGLHKSFGGVRALTDASLAATIGEVHALVGENGAGKSTVIKVLGGRLHPDSGSVRIKGGDVALSGPETPTSSASGPCSRS